MDIKLRKANAGDLDFLFRLRNEEAVRKASFDSDPISLETHKKWLEKTFAHSDRVLFIAEENCLRAAQVRFDWLSDIEAEVSIAVTKKFRGRGYGSEILQKASAIFLEKFPKCRKIYAYIKANNQASFNSFEKAGYLFQKATERKGQKCVEMAFYSPLPNTS